MTPVGNTVCPGRNLHRRGGALADEGDAGLAQALSTWADVGQAIKPRGGRKLQGDAGGGYWSPADESGTPGQVSAIEGVPGIVAQRASDRDGPSDEVYWDGAAARWVARTA